MGDQQINESTTTTKTTHAPFRDTQNAEFQMENLASLRQTHFKLGENENTTRSYVTTTASSYNPKKHSPPSRPKVLKSNLFGGEIMNWESSNKSDFRFPEGGKASVTPHGKEWLRGTHFKIGGNLPVCNSTYQGTFVTPPPSP